VASPAAPGQDRGLAGFGQVDRSAVDGHRLGARRHRYDQVLTTRPLLVGAHAVMAAFGPEVLRAKGAEVAARRITEQNDTAAVATVTAVGTAAGHVRLAAEGDRAVATGATLHVDVGLVVKHLWRVRAPFV